MDIAGAAPRALPPWLGTGAPGHGVPPLGFVLATAWWSLLVTLPALGLGLLITLVGLPILVGTLCLWMGAGENENRRVRAVLAYLEGFRGT